MRGRQSPDGGFCFYRFEGIEEPNLDDTYHAVGAFALLGIETPHKEEVARFLEGFPIRTVDHLFHRVVGLQRLGYRSRIGEDALSRIRDATVDPDRHGIATSHWLERARRILVLKHRFARIEPMPDVIEAVARIRRSGGYGEKANLVDTFRCLAILELLGAPLDAEPTRRFVDGLQAIPYGFTLTADSGLVDLGVTEAGLRCCEMLDMRVRYRDEILRFTLACQSSRGGFSRVPDALPDIEMTHRALVVLHALDPSLVAP